MMCHASLLVAPKPTAKGPECTREKSSSTLEFSGPIAVVERASSTEHSLNRTEFCWKLFERMMHV